MKNLQICFIVFLWFFYGFSQTNACGTAVDETFDGTGALPSQWIEYNTSGQVTVADGRLKLDYTTDKPAVYHNFDPVTDDFSYSFDVAATRNFVDCNMSLLSSTGEYLTNITFALESDVNIQYATTMEAAIPSGYTGVLLTGNFGTNKTYSVSMNVDLTNQKIDFYNDGVLMAADIPFLENAQDVAKIDIQLNFMYNNEGRFFFDNILLLNGEENRSLLTSNVNTAEALIGSASVGNEYSQYPQSAIDAFQLAIDDANAVLADCDATSNTIDTSLSDLQAAQDLFLAAQVNDPVLKIYEAYDFSGEAHEVYCGYYNGDLGAYDDWAVSFTLEKGYMATFAQDVNGLGVSKVYVASEEDLQINLPEELQRSISFIRVSPWKDVHKKGIGAKGTDVVAALNNSWHYNWGTTGEAVGDAEFVPNQWGGGTVDKAISLGQRMDISHYMAFNEPDNDDQSNMTVDRAIEKYPELLASGLRLGSPANTDGNNGATWRDEFMTKAEAAGLRVDYMVVHYYKKTSPVNFYNWLKAIYDKWQRPIWIKEFNYGATWTDQPASNEAAGNGLISYMNMLDDTDFVERYAVFTWQPDKPIYSLMTVRTPVTLSSSGIMYRDHVSPVGYTQETYTQGPQLSVDENDMSSQVVVFPTLVKEGFLNIVYSNAIKSSNIELSIYNSTGQLVKQVLNSKETINVNNLSSGFYIIKIKSSSNNITKKFIIQ